MLTAIEIKRITIYRGNKNYGTKSTSHQMSVNYNY